jgi:hypothetical protein
LDSDSFELLDRVVEAQVERLRSGLAHVERDQRGSTYVEFVGRHLCALDTRVSEIRADFGSADEAERTFHARKLLRIRALLNEFHGEVLDYRSDIGRKDLPSGLLHLVDYLIEDLLKASADPIIHLDSEYMYSTQRLLDRWRKISNDLGIEWTETVEPVIFNLPGLDPGNALLAPVLAHEVGHSVIQRNDLVATLDSRLDSVALQLLKDEYLASSDEASLNACLGKFSFWAVELLCDALATELTGPSFAFSVAVFFPASSAGQSGPKHPDPAQRFSLALHQLKTNGWEPALRRLTPNVFSWLEGVERVQPMVPPDADERFLRNLVDFAIPSIAAVAKEYVGSCLDWGSFEPLEDTLGGLIAAGIPPAELAGEPVPPWHTVAAIWLYGIAVHGDVPAGLVRCVEDVSLNGFTLKTIEMIRVLKLWKDNHAPAA